MRSEFELLLFSVDPFFIAKAVEGGVAGIMVDWERRGKDARQDGYDTQINVHTLDDLRRVRAATHVPIITRINGFGDSTVDEIEMATGAGTDEILLPMVRTGEEVEAVLKMVDHRCDVGIMVETIGAAMRVDQLARLPLRRVYVGLNDLGIERGTANIFEAVADGTVEHIRRPFEMAFGFAGLTLPDRGSPIPCPLLIGEMARLKSDFSFLRRSFHADVAGRDPKVEVPRIHAAFDAAYERSEAAVSRDRQDLCARISRIGSRSPAECRGD